MEIGSAYALQVCLLQIPCMVAFSLWYNWGKEELAQYTFRYAFRCATMVSKGGKQGEILIVLNSLVFPRWDVISVIMSVFLLTYTYQEGKSNYFKGSILVLSYLVLVSGFYFIPSATDSSALVGFDPRTLAQLLAHHQQQ